MKVRILLYSIVLIYLMEICPLIWLASSLSLPPIPTIFKNQLQWWILNIICLKCLLEVFNMEIELRSKWVYVHKWNFLWDFDLKLVYCKGIIWHYRLFIIYSWWRDLCTFYQLKELIILSSKQPRYSSDKAVFLVRILDLLWFSNVFS